MATHSYEGPISVDAASRIVTQTRAARRSSVDLELLAHDLNRRLYQYAIYNDLDKGSRSEAFKLLKNVAARSKSLHMAVTDPRFRTQIPRLVKAAAEIDGSGGQFQDLGFAPWFSDFGHIQYATSEQVVQRSLAGLGHFSEIAKKAVRGGPSPKLKRSAIETLVAKWLPEIFNKHFGARFGAGTAGDSAAEGPGLRFVLACLGEAAILAPNGKKYSAETVRTYWHTARRGKSRRIPDNSRKKS
jgi:hypothetical protein